MDARARYDMTFLVVCRVLCATLIVSATSSEGLLVMVALCNRETIYIFMLFLLLLLSSPNLSGRRLDVYHTLAHGVALVRI